MKHIRYRKLFGWFVAATLLLTTSCKDELFGEYSGGEEEVAVSFNITTEAAAGTRGGTDGDGKTYPHISDGSKADLLIYAVYQVEKNEDGTKKYTLLEDYDMTDDATVKAYESKHGLGQTVLPLGEDENITQDPKTITLRLKRGQEYAIAFWAQSKECDAYETKDLRKVEMKYSEVNTDASESRTTDDEDTEEEETDPTEGENGSDASTKTSTPNNDERRDAFCQVVEFTAGDQTGEFSSEGHRVVKLRRPLAQINAGTSGFDFETITRDATKKYTYSKIRINRVARYLDVVEDKTYNSTTGESFGTSKTPEAFAVADYGYAPLPAYVNIDIPEYPSYTVWDWAYNKDYDKDYPHIDKHGKADYIGEEFLRVKLYDTTGDGYSKDEYKLGDNGDVEEDKDDYLDYANLSKYNEDLSETFKYLSMCYVLTSSTKDEPILINNIKMWMATDADGSDEVQILDINNVPAQRNWRTNIVGNILTEKNDYVVKLDNKFGGEFNGIYNDGKAQWSGPIAKGVYYDGEADEIQISDADGLLWLQRMVNGQIVIRETKENYKTIAGKNLKYYVDDSTTGTEFEYEYIDPDKLSDDVIKRIIKATHIEKMDGTLSQYASKGGDNPKKVGSNNDIYWPNNYNFNFYGATIKLMADIDLAGIEWVPIGWDLALHDTSLAGGEKGTTIDYLHANYTQGKRRIFCGTFDGNGHTIKNLKTIRFTANVYDASDNNDRTSQQLNNYKGPYDNFQWYPYGLFGMVVDHAKIMNVRLQNVDIKGYDACGALVGIVFNGDAPSGETDIEGDISITNCYVDGGSVSLSPMYRGDSKIGTDGKATSNRTFARGVYSGGLVGNIVIGVEKTNFELANCDVRNLTIRAYRQTGGLVGGIGNYENYKTNSTGMPWEWSKQRFDLAIHDNSISNVLIICNQFQAFYYLDNGGGEKNDTHSDMWRNGFGWDAGYRTLAHPVVGGIYVVDSKDQELVDGYNNQKGNVYNNVTIAEFATKRELTDTIRTASVGSAPLYELPMLSSWFCDSITLTSNYFGQPSAYVGINDTHQFAPKSKDAPNEKFSTPFKLPYDLAPDYDTSSSQAGVYVESVILDGSGGIGGRSVITPTDITGSGSCVMYVTARNRKQFYDKLSTDLKKTKSFKKPTTIRNMVLRGEPWAWAGLQIAPNENMSEVILENVAIYDVYRTITLDSDNNRTKWTNATVKLTVDDSNLRGYTVPGSGWQQIAYKNTTFEEGTFIKSLYTKEDTPKEQAYTYLVEAPTTFTTCFFKSPYIIDLTKRNGNTVKFEGKCEATSTSMNSVHIQLEGKPWATCEKIEVGSTALGEPYVLYHMPNDGGYYECTLDDADTGTHYDKDGKVIEPTPARRR